jgi:undecaprenyl-diphosphatase
MPLERYADPIMQAMTIEYLSGLLSRLGYGHAGYALVFIHGVLELDERVLHWFEAHRSDGATALLMLVSRIHAPAPILAATGVLAAWLWHERDRNWLGALAWAVPGGMLVNTALKLLFHRARPVLEHPLLALHSYSFPSGHVVAATLFYGMLCAIVLSRTRSRSVRWSVCVASGCMVALVAISRMYLGAHFLSDVLAAFSEAIVWLALVLAVTRARFADSGARHRPTR